jgi:hypothetical protein
MLLQADPSTIPVDAITTGALPGREGWVGWQAGALASARR